MNQSKRGKGRGGSNRGRRNTGSPNHPSFNQAPSDDLEQGSCFENPFFVHAVTSLLGCQVQLTTPSGAVYDGILKAVSPKVEVALDVAHKLTKKNIHGKSEESIQIPTRNDTMDTLVFAARNILSIYAMNVDRDQVAKKDNFTDQAISSRLNGQVGHERQLQKWEAPGGENDVSIILEDTDMYAKACGSVKSVMAFGCVTMGQRLAQFVTSEVEVQVQQNGLDADEMFATNEKKYGVKSSYDSEMLSYTTPLEKSSSKDFKERERKAEMWVREIEQGGSFVEHSEVDSGKSEEELYSSVVRGGTPTSGLQRYIPPALRSKPAQAATNREERKREQPPPSTRDQPAVSQSRPQRSHPNRVDVQTSDASQRVEQPLKPSISDHVSEEAQQGSTASPPRLPPDDATLNASISNTPSVVSPPVRKGPSVSPVSGKPTPHVSGSAAQAGIAIRAVIPAAPGPNNHSSVKSNVEVSQKVQKTSVEKSKSELEELKNFTENFKLVDSMPTQPKASQEEQGKKVETSTPDVPAEPQKPEPSGGSPGPQAVRQRDSPKCTSTVVEQKGKQSPQATEPSDKGILQTSKLNPKAKEFKMNPNAKEFRPAQPALQRTPPLTAPPHPYPQGVPLTLPVPVPYSPNSGRPTTYSIPQTQIYKGPRSPLHGKGMQQRFFSRDPGGEPLHGSVMSAALATGNPIITQGSSVQQYIPVAHQTMPFPGVMQHMIPQPGGIPNMYVMSASSQPGQPRYVQPQSAGMTTASVTHSVAQAYQEATQAMPIYVSNIPPMAATPPHQSPAQPSPSQQGQFFQYQAIPQLIQQGGMPHPPQGHIGAPSPSQMGPHPHLVYLQHPQQAGPSGVQVSAPNPQMAQFIPGATGYPAPRKQQPNWHPQQHPSVQSYPPGN